MDILETLGLVDEGKEKPLERGQAHGGLQEQEKGLIVVFMTRAQLEAYGPLALREWLKRTHRAPRTTGEVVAFGHQEACGRDVP